MALNVRQKRFCEEYVRSGNATQSAIFAGYSEKTAYSIGQRLLKHVEVKSYIDELSEQLADENILSAKEVMSYLSDVVKGKTVDEVVLMNQKTGAVVRVKKETDEATKIRAATEIMKRYPLASEVNLNIVDGFKIQIGGEDIDETDS